MIAIKGLAVAAVLGAGVLALAPRSIAGPGVETFTLTFTYDAEKSALDNYLGFVRAAERACEADNARALAMRKHERACVGDVIDRLVERMGRPELAAVHADRIGGRDDSSRTLAAR